MTASDEVARAIDAVQTQSDEGPCLRAATDGTMIRVPDLALETRWPTFVRRALADTPVRSILTIQLDPEGSRSALNLYSGRAHAFSEDSVTMAALCASHAQVAMMQMHAASRTVNLEQALTASRQIGAAVGILMAVHKVTEDQAFQMLRGSSNHLNRKLRDVAEEVTETGALP